MARDSEKASSTSSDRYIASRPPRHTTKRTGQAPRAGGGNGAYPIIGDADDVASLLLRLHGAGIDAFAMGFANYTDHLPYFRDEVLPRLADAGVR